MMRKNTHGVRLSAILCALLLACTVVFGVVAFGFAAQAAKMGRTEAAERP